MPASGDVQVSSELRQLDAVRHRRREHRRVIHLESCHDIKELFRIYKYCYFYSNIYIFLMYTFLNQLYTKAGDEKGGVIQQFI